MMMPNPHSGLGFTLQVFTSAGDPVTLFKDPDLTQPYQTPVEIPADGQVPKIQVDSGESSKKSASGP
jgi:hypothetical protein